MKTCVICQRPFASAGNWKTCSEECSRERLRRYRKRNNHKYADVRALWRARNRNYISQKWAEYYLANRPRLIERARADHVKYRARYHNQAVERWAKMGPQEKRERQAYQRAYYLQRHPIRKRKCRVCGAEFEVGGTGRRDGRRVICTSEQCYRKLRNASEQRSRKSLTDYYVRQSLHMNKENCPQEMIALRREHIKLRRLIRERTK